MPYSSFPEDVLEHVFSFVQSDKDRNAISLVCTSWFKIERWCRTVGGGYSLETATLDGEAMYTRGSTPWHWLPLLGGDQESERVGLRESEVEDLSGNWLSQFPDTCTSLVALNIACLGSEVSFSALERLVGRSPNLRTLRLNRAVPLDKLANLLRRAHQLVELGTGAYSSDLRPEVLSNLAGAFSGCKDLKGMSGFWDVVPAYLPAIYPRLWVLDYIEDSGLEALAASCKDLQELRVFPSEPFGVEPNVSLTEQGLVCVSEACPKLKSVLYFCRRFSNDALVTIARNRPNMTRFRLCIIEPRTPDYLTHQSLDTGFGAIVEHCKDLRHLSLSGLLTDHVFEYIGTYAQKLEMLSVAFAGESDLGHHRDSLRKLEIRDCPFGDKALLANAAKLETMRSL
ncbi:hypothetical protein LWI28_022588 [Acer negundo]|uniref:COI1 F-box domain-containing protein n=1 Tax=Acer negundo TaxID=4023 RepID=A0AAD5NIQ0_ACENE|nr:hypothetical protein LWI28_007734 [Acer negundo]KAI9161980.1 hypothetical protein LWI28_022588 [Acer negundo]